MQKWIKWVHIFEQFSDNKKDIKIKQMESDKGKNLLNGMDSEVEDSGM